MATIGTFTKSGDTFTGSVKTLSINAKTTIKRLLRLHRVRGGLEEDLQRGPGLPLGQAR